MLFNFLLLLLILKNRYHHHNNILSFFFLSPFSTSHSLSFSFLLHSFLFFIYSHFLQFSSIFFRFLQFPQGLIHADLKPDNILLVSNPCEKAIWGALSENISVKVVDFGNSFPSTKSAVSFPSSLSFSFTFPPSHFSSLLPSPNPPFPSSYPFSPQLYYDDYELQTPSHRAPEVLFGIPFSYKIDVWSVGCVILNLLTPQDAFSLPQGEADSSPVERRGMLLKAFAKILGPVPIEPFRQALYTDGFFFLFFSFLFFSSLFFPISLSCTHFFLLFPSLLSNLTFLLLQYYNRFTKVFARKLWKWS